MGGSKALSLVLLLNTTSVPLHTPHYSRRNKDIGGHSLSVCFKWRNSVIVLFSRLMWEPSSSLSDMYDVLSLKSESHMSVVVVLQFENILQLSLSWKDRVKLFLVVHSIHFVIALATEISSLSWPLLSWSWRWEALNILLGWGVELLSWEDQ